MWWYTLVTLGLQRQDPVFVASLCCEFKLIWALFHQTQAIMIKFGYGDIVWKKKRPQRGLGHNLCGLAPKHSTTTGTKHWKSESLCHHKNVHRFHFHTIGFPHLQSQPLAGQKYSEIGWCHGSVVMKVHCSSRGPKFHPQNPHVESIKRTSYHKLSPDFHMCAVAHVPTYIHYIPPMHTKNMTPLQKKNLPERNCISTEHIHIFSCPSFAVYWLSHMTQTWFWFA